MEISIIDILYIVLFLIGCLLLFTVMYDHCVNNMKWSSAFKNRVVLFFISPITAFFFKVFILVAIFYLIYAVMHNSSLF